MKALGRTGGMEESPRLKISRLLLPGQHLRDEHKGHPHAKSPRMLTQVIPWPLMGSPISHASYGNSDAITKEARVCNPLRNLRFVVHHATQLLPIRRRGITDLQKWGKEISLVRAL